MTTGQSLAGFRLTRLEVRNWGTFDGLVWTLVADGRNTLVTNGDAGGQPDRFYVTADTPAVDRGGLPRLRPGHGQAPQAA